VPVAAVAVDYLLQPYEPAVNAAPTLARLVNMQFVRRDAGRYYLHQVDRDYALGLIPIGQPGDGNTHPPPFTRHVLRCRGADYFTQIRTPRDEWKTLDDLAPQLAEFELRYQNETYDAAAQVLFGIDFKYLMHWGHYRYVADLHGRLQGHLTNPFTIFGSKNNLAEAHRVLGEFPKAITLLEQALAASRKTGDQANESVHLGNLGNCYYESGQISRAIELYEQALAVARQVGDRQGEAAYLGNLGNRYSDLGLVPRAIELCEQALAINREIGYRYGEGSKLDSLGKFYAQLGEWQQAIEYSRQSIEVADAIGSAQYQAMARHNLAETHLFAGDLSASQEVIETARNYRYPAAQSGIALVSGIARLRQGAAPAAAQAFRDAIARAEQQLEQTPTDYDALDTKAVALAGLTLTGPKTTPPTPQPPSAPRAKSSRQLVSSRASNGSSTLSLQQTRPAPFSAFTLRPPVRSGDQPVVRTTAKEAASPSQGSHDAQRR